MIVPFVSLDRENSALLAPLTASFRRVLESGRYLMGTEVERFEDMIADWHGVPVAVGCSSGSDACEIAMRAAGWGEGTRVATPAFGAVPTISAIEAAGATPVLVDVDPITRGVSRDTLAAVKHDGAIVVHMFGVPCYVPPDAIEDCAHAQGARSDGRLVGTIGRAGALSFFPTKCLGNMGDGGAVVTSDTGLAARAIDIRHYGGLLSGDVMMRGQNSRISELSAALLSVKLKHLEGWNARRREIARRYNDELAGRLVTPTIPDGAEVTFHCYVVEHPKRDWFRAALQALGVQCMTHYLRAIHQYDRWKRLAEPGQFPVAEKLAATVLSLPVYPMLSEQEVEYVIKCVKEIT